MKKKILLVTILALFSELLFASPFGLRMGMDLNEIAQVCGGQRPEKVDTDCYIIVPEKKHPLFTKYYVWVDDTEGLYYIKALSDDIQTNDYGTELQNKFFEISNRISKSYGVPIINEKIDKSYVLTADAYWMMSIKDGARKLSATWMDNLKDDLYDVYLYVSAKSYNSGKVNLEYRFTNADAVEDSQDDVF